MKYLILSIVTILLPACSFTPKNPTAQEVWKLEKACQFYKDIHREVPEECKGFILQDNKMPEN